jgi:hypothetical protein
MGFTEFNWLNGPCTSLVRIILLIMVSYNEDGLLLSLVSSVSMRSLWSTMILVFWLLEDAAGGSGAMRGWNAVAGLRARNGWGPPCRISPDPRMTKAIAPRTPPGTITQVIPTLLSLARLRLPLHGALSVTKRLTVTFWSWWNCVMTTLDGNLTTARNDCGQWSVTTINQRLRNTKLLRLSNQR